MIINDDNPIQNWFKLHIEPTNNPEDIITNEQIRLELKYFIKEQKIDYDTETSKYSIDVGLWMKENFEHKMNDKWNDVKKRQSYGQAYKGFKLKTDSQIKRDYNTNYVIDEDAGLATDNNMYMLNEDEKIIFNKIKASPNIHHKKLRKGYPKLNLEDVITSLWEKGFIKRTEQTNHA